MEISQNFVAFSEYMNFMIVRYDKIKSIALAQGNDFNFNISLTRRQIKLIKKKLLSQSRAKLRHGFTFYFGLIVILKLGQNDAMGNIQRCFALSLPVKSQKIGPLPPLPSLLLAKVCSQAVSQRESVSKRPIVAQQPKSRSNRAREGVTNGLSQRKTPFKATLSFLENARTSATKPWTKLNNNMLANFTT